MKSSSLNEHLYTKNIIDSPNCLCGEIESTHHYLFMCPIYTCQQNSLFRKLLQLLNIRIRKIYYYLAVLILISTQILLFLTTVHKYIPQSKRFHKTQIHHVIFYPECNLQFPFFSPSFNFQLFKQC